MYKETPKHPDIVKCLNNVGRICYILGNYTEALRYGHQALKKRPGYYVKAKYFSNIGSAYYALGNYTEALKYYQQVLKMHRKLFEEDHPFVAISLANLGQVYGALSRPLEAIDCFEQALAQRENPQEVSESPQDAAGTLPGKEDRLYGGDSYQPAQ